MTRTISPGFAGSLPRSLRRCAVEPLEPRRLLSATISGQVFNDYNLNSAHDAGEPGLGGWTVWADVNLDGQHSADEALTTTDASGDYVLGGVNVAAGQYVLLVAQPPADTTFSTSYLYMPVSDPTQVTTANFAVTGAQIHVTTFDDQDGDGQWGNEPTLGGQTVYLDLNGNGALDGSEPSGTTDADGRYTFYPQQFATYIVRIAPAGGWSATNPDGVTAMVSSDDAFASPQLGAHFDGVVSQAPIVYAPANQATAEGTPTYFTLGSFDDTSPGAAPYSVSVDWGDQQPPTQFTTAQSGDLGDWSYSYADDGSYHVTVSVMGADGLSGSASFDIAVANKPPTATFSNDGPVKRHHSAAFAFSSPADAPADVAAGFRYSFDFNNDGDFVDPGDILNATSPIASHTFADAGTYTVRGRVTDKDGGFSDYTTQLLVQRGSDKVKNKAKQKASHKAVVHFGAANTGVFTGPAASRLYAIDWNDDGVIDQVLTGRRRVHLVHSFATAGVHRVGVYAAGLQGTFSSVAFLSVDAS